MSGFRDEFGAFAEAEILRIIKAKDGSYIKIFVKSDIVSFKKDLEKCQGFLKENLKLQVVYMYFRYYLDILKSFVGFLLQPIINYRKSYGYYECFV